jgi:hypothetical protein
MPNSDIVSELNGFVIDIEGGAAHPTAGTHLDAFTQKGQSNQFWTLVPSTKTPGVVFIESVLKDPAGQTLVVNISGSADHPTPGTKLDVWQKVSPEEGRQLWSFASATKATNGGIVLGPFIVSNLTDPQGNPLVINISGSDAKPSPGVALDVWTADGGSRQNWLYQAYPPPPPPPPQ